MSFYIFTTQDATEIVLVKDCQGLGIEAEIVRSTLEAAHHKPVVAWCCMGGANPEPKLSEASSSLYRLRNGIVVETGRPDAVWSHDVFVVSVPPDYTGSWKVGQHNNLVSVSDDPLTWVGAAHGKNYDVVGIVDHEREDAELLGE